MNKLSTTFKYYIFAFFIISGFLNSITAQNIHHCGTSHHLQKYLKNHPAYRKIIESNELKIQRNTQVRSQGRVEETLYQIPVVVHVLEDGTGLISDNSIHSAIKNLNDAFRGRGKFLGSPDINIEFVLAQRTPDCQASTGIVRVDARSITGYQNYGIKYNIQGGNETELKKISKWNNLDYYNIWIVSKIDGRTDNITGYAYYPGASSNVDGMVILASHFNESKETLIHEMGHALNLFHTFEGDNDGTQCPPQTDGCGRGAGDCVSDTEAHQRSRTFTCLSGLNSCTSKNYEDNVRFNHMNYYCHSTLFTQGQKQRMRSALEHLRSSLINSEGEDVPEALPVSTCIPTKNALNFLYGTYQIKLNNLTITSSSSQRDGTHYTDNVCLKNSHLKILEKYNLQLSPISSLKHVFGAWADWNNDGDFEDVGETLTTNPSQNTIIFTVPNTTKVGKKLRFRVLADEAKGQQVSPCQLAGRGQIEDFSVKLEKATLSRPEIEVWYSNQLISGASLINFSNVNTGEFSEQTFTVHNLGNTTLTFDNPKITIAGSSDFVIKNNLPASISAGNSANFTIRFTPSSDGLKMATVTIQNNDSDESNYAFGVSARGTFPKIEFSNGSTIFNSASTIANFEKLNLSDKQSQTFNVKNTGTGILHFTDNQIVKLNDSTDFRVLGTLPKQLKAGEQMNFSVEFAPLSVGFKTAQLTISSNLLNSPFIAFISGKGVLPKMKLFQNTKLISNHSSNVHFTSVEVNQAITHNFKIENVGEGYLQIKNLKLTSSTPNVFSLNNVINEFVSSQKNTNLSLNINPKISGKHTAKIEISTNDPTQNPFTFFVTITAMAPKMEVSHLTQILENKKGKLDFSTIILGNTSLKKYLKVKNTGNSKLDFSNTSPFSIRGTGAADFQIDFTSLTLNPFEVGIVEIRFKPTAKNHREAELVLSNNTPYTNPFVVKLTGEGIAVEPSLEVDGFPHGVGVANFSGGEFEQISKTFTITNTGIVDLTLNSSISIHGLDATEFQIVNSFATTVVAPKQSTQFTIKLQRNNPNAKQASVQIFSNDPEKNPYTFQLRADRILPPPPTATQILAQPFPEVRAEIVKGQVRLVWRDTYLLGKQDFEVYRTNTTTGKSELIATMSGQDLQDNFFVETTELQPETSYTYSVRAVYKNLSSEFGKIQIVTPPSLPKLEENKKICEGNKTSLRVKGTVNTQKFHWYESDSSSVPLKDTNGQVIESSTFQTPILFAPKTYYVAPIGRDFESTKRLPILVEVEPKSEAVILNDSLIQICENELVILHAKSVLGAKYVWYRDGLNIHQDTINTLTVNRAGYYVLEVETGTCRTYSDTVEIRILEVPKIKFPKDQLTTFCGEGSVQVLTAKNVEYEWFTENGIFLTKGNQLNTMISGNFQIKATHVNGCSEMSEIEVVVHPYPVAPLISVNNPICEGKKVQFQVEKIPNATYHWQGFLLNSRAQNPVLDYSNKLKSGNYTLTVDVNGCKSFSTVHLIVGAKMDYELEKDNITCYGAKDGNIHIKSKNSNLLSYRLDEFGQMKFGLDATFDSLDYGSHLLIIENEEGCEQIHEIFIDEPEDFEISVLDEEITTSRWKSVQLEAFGVEKFKWFPANGLDNDSIANPIANPLKTTIYTVVGTAENGCERTSQVIVNVLGEDEILPNLVLSPNGDGVNDVWEIQNIESFPNVKIEVYSRMGLKVFERTHYQNDWDGTLDGRWLPEGVYFYKILLPEENRILAVGDLNLLR